MESKCFNNKLYNYFKTLDGGVIFTHVEFCRIQFIN
jgi:hypothetical protein